MRVRMSVKSYRRRTQNAPSTSSALNAGSPDFLLPSSPPNPVLYAISSRSVAVLSPFLVAFMVSSLDLFLARTISLNFGGEFLVRDSLVC